KLTTILKHMPSIHIHPILMVFIAIAFITGTFMELTIILAIVFIHELGHYSMGQLFKWRIRGIMLWIFGGVMDTDEHGNRPIHEEVLVTIAGPFQHIVIYVVVFFVSSANLLPASVLELIIYYNTAIFIFTIYFKCIFINDFSLYGKSNRVEASVFCIYTLFIKPL